MSERTEDSVLGEWVDELQVQAWLARRERKEPSVKGEPHQEEVRVLAQMRDELALQLHLGKLEGKDRFHAMEEHWRWLVQNDLKPAAHSLSDNLENAVQNVLTDIRNGYHSLVG